MAVMLLSTTALSQDTSKAPQKMSRERQDSSWLANACTPAVVDTTGWPRYQIGDVSIAMPPQYRVSRQIPYTLIFRGSYASVRVTWMRNAKYAVYGPNRASSTPRPREAWCDGSHGGYPGVVHTWIEAGRYNFVTKWEPIGGDETEWLSASFGTSRPEEATLLHAALSTVQAVKDDPTSEAGANPNGWYWNPCVGDSVDSWGWTRYDLHGIRLRAPNEVRQVKAPDQDELQFRTGNGTLRLRLHNDASKVLADLSVPSQAPRRCNMEVSGRPAEVISFGKPGDVFGFAVLWPDAERGEWLAAWLYAPKLEEATLLRRVLFTIVFPDKR
jgi:hypothetical protein